MSNAEHAPADAASNGFDATADRLKSAAMDVAEETRHQAKTLRDTVGAAAHDTASHMQDAGAQLKTQVQAAGDTATDAVRRNPGLAVAGAVGVGVLLGLALSRRS